MKKQILIGITSLTLTCIQLTAQTTKPQQPAKTGNEWKMPSDVFKRSKGFAEDLKKKLELDPSQTKKVYDAYLANTKPLDEILILPIPEKEKEAALKANKLDFNKKLENIFTAAQYSKYLKLSVGK